MRLTGPFIRISALAICAAMLLCPLCAMGETSLTIGVKSVKTTYLNPLAPAEREMQGVTSLIYDSLIALDDNYEPVPCLAVKWDAYDNGSTWMFTLRSGVTFHDGSEMTAYDAAATINQILALAEENRGQYMNLKYMVKSASASDKYTLVIRSSRSCYGLLYALTFPILRADEINANDPVGTGPYYVTAFDPGQELLLTANESYWNGAPGYKELNFMLYTTNKELLSAYEYKNVDAIITKSATAAQYRGGTSSLNVPYRGQQLEVLMMNESAYPLEDPDIRRAIRYAIDIDAIASTVYGDMVVRTDTFMIPGTWLYKDSELYTYDPDRAVQILTDKGWSDTDGDGVLDLLKDGSKRNLKLRVYVYEEQENSVRIQAANMVADYLNAIGIKADVTTYTYKDAKVKLEKRSYDLCLCAFQMDEVPDPGFILIRNNVCNYMGYRSDKMDDLIKNGLRKALDRNSYQRYMFEIQDLFAEDCPFICFYYRTGAILTRTLFLPVRDVREPNVLRGIETFYP
ncbi:MAG: hypothetical protein CW338_04150 [Clostridiales bacterium]|nr:hypothetical protein [Clostridiales bacterium]